MFSRVDRSRDMLSYVRSLDDDNDIPKTIFIEAKRKTSRNRKNFGSILSVNAFFMMLICLLF